MAVSESFCQKINSLVAQLWTHIDTNSEELTQIVQQHLDDLKSQLPASIFERLSANVSAKTLWSDRSERDLWIYTSCLPEFKERLSAEEKLTLSAVALKYLPAIYAVKELGFETDLSEFEAELEDQSKLMRFEVSEDSKTDLDLSACKKDLLLQSECLRYMVDCRKNGEPVPMPQKAAKLLGELTQLGSKFFKINGDLLKSELQRAMMCQLCLSTARSPKTLPCLHTFCHSCLRTLLREHKKLIGCPRCEAPFMIQNEAELHDLGASFVVQAFRKCLSDCSEAGPAKCYLCVKSPDSLCVHCGDIFCESHAKSIFHESGSHRLLTFESIVLEPKTMRDLSYLYCPLHRAQISHFCTHCSVPVCSEKGCKDVHASHNRLLTPVQFYEDQFHKFSSIQGNLDDKLGVLEGKIEKAQQNQNLVTDMRNNVNDSINRYFDDIQKLIEVKRAAFLKESERISNECLEHDEATMLNLNAWINQMRKLKDEFENQFLTPGESSRVILPSELRAGYAQYLRQLWHTGGESSMADCKAISYPETDLRSLLQTVTSMTPKLSASPVQKGWELVGNIPGIRDFTIRKQQIYILRKQLIMADEICLLDLRQDSRNAQQLFDGGLRSYRGLAVSAGGHIYVAEAMQTNMELPAMKISRSLQVRQFSLINRQPLGSLRVGDLNNGQHALFLKWDSGKIYVADENCICEYSEPTGTDSGKLIRKFNFQSMLNIGDFVVEGQHKDLLFVIDKSQHCVLIFNSQAHVMQRVGKQGVTPGCFQDPSGLARDSMGHLAVADTGNRRVQFFNLEGQFIKQVTFPNALREGSMLNTVAPKTTIAFSEHYLYLYDSRQDSLWRMEYI